MPNDHKTVSAAGKNLSLFSPQMPYSGSILLQIELYNNTAYGVVLYPA